MGIYRLRNVTIYRSNVVCEIGWVMSKWKWLKFYIYSSVHGFQIKRYNIKFVCAYQWCSSIPSTLHYILVNTSRWHDDKFRRCYSYHRTVNTLVQRFEGHKLKKNNTRKNIDVKCISFNSIYFNIKYYNSCFSIFKKIILVSLRYTYTKAF